MSSGVPLISLPRRIHLDFEAAGTLDLRQVGVDVWSRHKDTRIILIGFAFEDDPPHVLDWAGHCDKGDQWPPWKYELMLAASNPYTEIHAWNAAFERIMWNNLLVKGGMPPLPVEQFHCTMAAAANAGLPMSLDDAAPAVGASHVKDKAGHANMLRMARPRGFDDTGEARWWDVESIPKLENLRRYNMLDVEAEREVWRRIPRMTQRERAIWLLDQQMNDRGLPVDKELLGLLGEITLAELLRINAEIKRVTQGFVESATQQGKLLAWLQSQGYPRPDLRKDTLKEFIGTPAFFNMTGDAQYVLTLRAEAAKTSTAKLKSIGHFAQADSRARHLVQYGGAVRTLRWAGRGPQIQNFPRPVIRHTQECIREILAGMPADGLRLLFGRPLDVVSSCLRGVFKAPEGHKFIVCDYHAIEAIVLGWLADHQKLLDVFRRGEDVYVYTANMIGSTSRTLGKVMRLALGYGMGPGKFQDTAKTYGLELSALDCDQYVRSFRYADKPITSLWYRYDAAAKEAISNPGHIVTVGHGKVKFRMAKPDGRLAGALLIEKPNGGNLVYRDAKIEDGRITYMGVHQTTRQWTKLDTYGGKLVENVTQAVARDLLADAMKSFDQYHPGILLTTIHDEIIAMVETAYAQNVLSHLKLIMSTPPAWGQGLPLSAAGYVADRYSKA